ncbi:hypothetical protein [Nocardia sp. NPDC052566]|uniref:hypothetical protein n=1 Tax=Nocardia sp. NPDC052566 TaxID=3364330 RepID=UPI0037CC1A58
MTPDNRPLSPILLSCIHDDAAHRCTAALTIVSSEGTAYMREEVQHMPVIPIRPGIYRIHAHIIGPSSLVTATEHAVEHGAPVITDRMNPMPIEQEWAIAPVEPLPGAPYYVHLAMHEAAGLVVHSDRLWVNGVPRGEWAKFTFEGVIGGVKIISDKGLAWRAGYRGAQIQLTQPKPEFQETFTLEFVRPAEEE